MISWLKKYIYPHEGNSHHPHLLRNGVSSFILSAIFFAEVVFLLSILVILPNTDFFATIFPNVLVDSTNLERSKVSENQLTVSPILQRAAQAKANDMATKGYFAHTSPDGLTPWYWLEQSGYSYTQAGENLAINFVDSKDVIIAWMNSPGHRANILNQNYTEIGIATAKGQYKGQEATFVAQFFGKPNVQTVLAIPIEQSPSASPILSPISSVQPDTNFISAENSQVKSEATTTETIPPAINHSSFKDRLLSNPKNLVDNILLMVVLGFIFVTMLTLLMHNGTIKTRAVLNGIVSIAIIITIVYFNQYIGGINSGIS